MSTLSTRRPNPTREEPDRNLALELVRVTEAAAIAAGRWVGRGDKNGGDGAAVDAMRKLIGSVSMRGVVVIGEGDKDEVRCRSRRVAHRQRRPRRAAQW